MLENIKNVHKTLFWESKWLIMKNDVTDYSAAKIASYIEYLKNEHNLNISVHFANKYGFMRSGRDLPGFHYYEHYNAYCLYVKNVRHLQRKCWHCQMMAAKKCERQESYEGTCYAGVHEYIRRFKCREEVAGFVSVSGYRDKNVEYGQNEWYDNNMRDEELPYELLETVIPPLCAMLTNLMRHVNDIPITDSVYYQMLAYIAEQHADVTLDALSAKFNYSKSYISHMFKRESGYTLKEYCNLLKIEDAKVLLKESNISITNVALSTGYNNFSYFINTFKRITGETPLVWRKRAREEGNN